MTIIVSEHIALDTGLVKPNKRFLNIFTLNGKLGIMVFGYTAVFLGLSLRKRWKKRQFWAGKQAVYDKNYSQMFADMEAWEKKGKVFDPNVQFITPPAKH